MTSALFTDFYSLTMAQGYWKRNQTSFGCSTSEECYNEYAVFEMFFRSQPFDGGYAIFAGLGCLLEKLKSFTFSDDDITYLKSLNIFEEKFIDYLKTFRFNGTLWSMDEGTVVFPQEPLIRVEGNFIECQIIEGLLLNIINFQSLIATKTCRIWLASGKGKIMEFGLRRAQGPDGSLSASRAAFIGGASGTSNTLAGKIFGIPVMGTMAHSWVMSFNSEEEAFENYAGIFPDRTVFLIDTYDTLNSGILNAIKAGKKLADLGKNFGVRLDSGDIQYLSAEVRKKLDEAGFEKAFISVSNDLDEKIIEALVREKTPVDSWGVGTKLVTGQDASAFTGVYKLAACISQGCTASVMKFSDNPGKTTNPGVKQVWRIKDTNGQAVADILGIDDSSSGGSLRSSDEPEEGKHYCFWHPSADYRHFFHTIKGSVKPLLKKRFEGGELTGETPSLAEIKSYAEAELDCFDSTYKRLLNPHIYKVSITEKLRSLKLELLNKHLGKRQM